MQDIFGEEFLKESLGIKSIYVANDAKDLVIEFNGEKDSIAHLINSKFNTSDSLLRAEIIISLDVEKAKRELNEAIETYEFLIEDDFQVWRKALPSKRVIYGVNLLGDEIFYKRE